MRDEDRTESGSKYAEPADVHAASALIARGARWQFYAQDAAPEASWASVVSTADPSWSEGPAQLGYGDGDEATTVPSNGSASLYFRKAISVPGPVGDAEVTVWHDDGVALFVNGTLVFRKYIDLEDVNAHDAYATARSADNEESTAQLPAEAFRPGENVIAAVVKQHNARSSDASFDLELRLTVEDDDPPGSDCVGQRLEAGNRLRGDEVICTIDGTAQFGLIGDELVFQNDSSRVTLASAEAGAWLNMQRDGNLVLYSPDRGPLWASGTAGSDGQWVAITGDGRTVAVRREDGCPLWQLGEPVDECNDDGDDRDGGHEGGAPDGGTPDGGGNSDSNTSNPNAPPEDCVASSQLDDGLTIPFYRLRLTYRSTSDHSKLTFDPDTAATLLSAAVIGEPTGLLNENSLTVQTDQIRLAQASGAKRADNALELVVDYAIRADALDRPFGFDLAKGSQGEVAITISLVRSSGAPSTLLRLGEYSAGTRNSGGPLSISLAEALRDEPPRQGELAPVRRMVWALYYAWYESHYWDSYTQPDDGGQSQLRDRPSASYYGGDGYYDSFDTQTIRKQIAAAKAAGIDGFLYSWFGPVRADGKPHRTDENAATVIQVANEEDFRIALFLEVRPLYNRFASDGSATVRRKIVEYIKYFHDQYAHNESVMKVDGKLAIMPFVGHVLSPEDYRAIRTSLRDQHGIEIFFVLDSNRPEYYPVIDGARGDYLGTGADQLSINEIKGRELRYSALLDEEASPKIWVLNAMPGYDDVLLGRPTYDPAKQVSRDGGRVFRDRMQAATSGGAQWIRIMSWNEYPEHTYIEPSQQHGSQYVDIAAEALAPWKCE